MHRIFCCVFFPVCNSYRSNSSNRNLYRQSPILHENHDRFLRIFHFFFASMFAFGGTRFSDPFMRSFIRQDRPIPQFRSEHQHFALERSAAVHFPGINILERAKNNKNHPAIWLGHPLVTRLETRAAWDPDHIERVGKFDVWE